VAQLFTSDLSPASGFIIEELSGNKRTILLTDRALPYRPLSLSGTMRVQITRYAGNPVATSQVLGAQEEPTSITGFWKDRFLQGSTFAQIDNVPVANVRELVTIVDDVRRKGQLVEVRWDEQTRQGQLVRFDQKWHNPHDVEWEIQFEWISQGEANPPPAGNLPDLSDLAAELIAVSQTTASVSPPSLLDRVAQFAVDMQVLQEAIIATADEARQVVINTVNAVSPPLTAASRTLAVLDTARREAQGLMDFAQQDVSRSIVQQPAADVSFGKTLACSLYLARARQAAKATRATAVNRGVDLQATTGARSSVISVRVRDGENLRSISTRVYGNQDGWRRIAQFNGLVTSDVPAGTLVLVPQTSPAQAQGAA